MREMESIKSIVHRRVHHKMVNDKRAKFNQQKRDLVFTKYEYEGLTRAENNYVNKI